MMVFTTGLPSPLLLVGRLDGRLQNSPAHDIWLARARVSAAVTIAGLAGVPIYVDDIMNWICGRSLPPRHREGLNDPLSVAALFHFALLAQETSHDAVASSTLAVLRTLLDDRAEAELWGRDDLVRFGSAFRRAQDLLTAPYPSPTLLSVAERLLEAHRALDVVSAAGQTVTTIDGRQLSLDPRTFGSVWLIGCLLPRALVSARLAITVVPSFVTLPRYLTGSTEELAGTLEQMLGKAAYEGLAELDRLEDRVAALPDGLALTSRSRLPELLRLQLAYPGLRVPAVAKLLGMTPQGAAKLVERSRLARQGRRPPSALE